MNLFADTVKIVSLAFSCSQKFGKLQSNAMVVVLQGFCFAVPIDQGKGPLPSPFGLPGMQNMEVAMPNHPPANVQISAVSSSAAPLDLNVCPRHRTWILNLLLLLMVPHLHPVPLMQGITLPAVSMTAILHLQMHERLSSGIEPAHPKRQHLTPIQLQQRLSHLVGKQLGTKEMSRIIPNFPDLLDDSQNHGDNFSISLL